MMRKEATLDSRLRNCLQTILELEETLTDSSLGPVLEKEFTVLKKVAESLEYSSVRENDVQRIEAATERFLEELQQSFDLEEAGAISQRRLLQ